MMRYLLSCVLLAALPAMAATQAATAPASVSASAPRPADAANGVWVTPKNKSHVRIYRAADGTYRGRIIWLKQPRYPADFKVHALAGKPKVDRHNHDKRLRARPVQGLVILSGFRYAPKKHAWTGGKCYDPEGGKTYTCRMWLKNSDTLMVRGYVFIFHKTQTWRRDRGFALPAASTHQ
ncbi:MAG: DUF2147 domain-containing protein [Gammaproteobacteria bacterium]